LARDPDRVAGDDVWALQDAKARLSELVDRALRTRRPQRITRRGAEAVVVLASDAYRRLTRQNARSLVEFLREVGPLPDDVIDRMNDRDRSTGRDVDIP